MCDEYMNTLLYHSEGHRQDKNSSTPRSSHHHHWHNHHSNSHGGRGVVNDNCGKTRRSPLGTEDKFEMQCVDELLCAGGDGADG